MLPIISSVMMAKAHRHSFRLIKSLRVSIDNKQSKNRGAILARITKSLPGPNLGNNGIDASTRVMKISSDLSRALGKRAMDRAKNSRPIKPKYLRDSLTKTNGILRSGFGTLFNALVM